MGHLSHHDAHTGHVVPISTFRNVLIALLILTILTVAIAQVNLGEWNILVAMFVASIKAGLVIFVFMHGKYENPIIWLYMAVPFILLIIMIGGIFLDNPFRIGDQMPEPAVTQPLTGGHGGGH